MTRDVTPLSFIVTSFEVVFGTPLFVLGALATLSSTRSYVRRTGERKAWLRAWTPMRLLNERERLSLRVGLGLMAALTADT